MTQLAPAAYECLRQPPCARDHKARRFSFEWRGTVGPTACPNCAHLYVDWLSFWCPIEDVWLYSLDGRPPDGSWRPR